VIVRALLLALALTATAASAALAPTPGTIRVALVEAARVVELRGTDIFVTETPGCESCGWRAELVRAVGTGAAVDIDGRRAPAFHLTSDRPIRLNGRDYVGRLTLIRNGEGLAVVNEVPLEEYLTGVLRAESSERWPQEALRAQAIVSRTYAAFYHTNSGGYTEDPRTVFAARNMPGLRAVVCPLATGSPHFQWSLDLRLADLGEALKRNGVGVGAVRGIEVTERTASLRATVVTVRGTTGTQRLRGNDLRRIVGYDTLKSTLFAVAIDGDLARFAGRGYGHGVGMCQWGAKGMAEQGSTAREILAFYYPGARLGSLDGR
jgi:stage II sporulation protein D (peptidoglycan lytic transglycosylase)